MNRKLGYCQALNGKPVALETQYRQEWRTRFKMLTLSPSVQGCARLLRLRKRVYVKHQQSSCSSVESLHIFILTLVKREHNHDTFPPALAESCCWNKNPQIHYIGVYKFTYLFIRSIKRLIYVWFWGRYFESFAWKLLNQVLDKGQDFSLFWFNEGSLLTDLKVKHKWLTAHRSCTREYLGWVKRWLWAEWD